MVIKGDGVMHSMLVTIGLVLDLAAERGLRVDVETTTGRMHEHVLVAGVDRFCVVLLDGTKAHVVAREHLVSVSLAQDSVLELTENTTLPAKTAG